MQPKTFVFRDAGESRVEKGRMEEDRMEKGRMEESRVEKGQKMLRINCK